MASRPRPFSHLASVARPAACATWLVLGGLFSGCARSVSPAEPGAEVPSGSLSSPKSTSEAETLEQAEADLERARLELAQLGGGPPARAGAAAAEPSPVTPSAEVAKKRASADEAAPAPPPPASRAPSREEKSSEQAESESSPHDGGNKCETTCKAYASLLRAKTAVCRLDAPNGARCARAEGIVRDATPQVQSCQCGS